MIDLKNKFNLISEDIAREFLSKTISNNNFRVFQSFSLLNINDETLFGSVSPNVIHNNDSKQIIINCSYNIHETEFDSRDKYKVKINIEANVDVFKNTPEDVINSFQNSVTPQLIKLHSELSDLYQRNKLSFDVEEFSRTIGIGKTLYSSEFVKEFLLFLKTITSEKTIDKINQAKKDVESIEDDFYKIDNHLISPYNQDYYKTINFLNKHDIICVAANLITKSNLNKKELDKPINKLFVKKFNEKIQDISNNKFKPVPIDEFFDYWEINFNDFGMFILNEIASSISEKHNSINERCILVYLIEEYCPFKFKEW